MSRDACGCDVTRSGGKCTLVVDLDETLVHAKFHQVKARLADVRVNDEALLLCVAVIAAVCGSHCCSVWAVLTPRHSTRVG